MCDKELLLDFLYGELDASQQERFERHLTSCAECRGEIDGLRGARAELASWAPPEPDLGFQIVRGAKVTPMPTRTWRPAPVWGLAAAALVMLAVSAAIANLEITVGSSGVTMRTGWNRRAAAQNAAAVSSSAADAAALQAISARVKDLESQLSARQPAVAVVPASTTAGGMSDAELIRLVRQLIAQSEQRQEGVLARQILQVNRDFENVRRNDNDRMRAGLMQIQGTAVETSQRQRALEDHIIRVGFQR
jgi:anti-sigma factor RsiW